MSLGEERVRLQFNPSSNTDVQAIKQRTAEMINWCNDRLVREDNPEIKRLLSLAMTNYEDAAMWAVKAVTG